MKLTPEKLKTYINPVDFYNAELGVVPASYGLEWYVGGLCPFHDDKRQGSFHINCRTGGYKCFACDAKGGDIISFLCQRYCISFRDALGKLSADWEVV